MSTKTAEIDWREWTPEALDLAAREDRPILLAITATWCHWCHVMDRTTFRDPEVAELINRRFVPVRADNDRRPDLNSRYNMGGWPTVALLTSEGDILTGATYLPPTQMVVLLSRVADVYESERSALAERAVGIRRQREQALAGAETPFSGEQIREGIISALESAYDPVYGGFGREQKFPQTPALELLLSNYRRTGCRKHLDMVTKTLDAMRNGVLFDSVEGGFFRYSTTRDWSVPHYEKMLEDNSGLLGVYAHAYGLTGDSRYLDTARSIVRYLESVLLDQDTGAFFGSQDADEDYYKLPLEERLQREPPSVDRAVYVSWNGTASAAFLKAYEATKERAYLDRALGVLEFLTRSCRRDGCFYHYFDGEPREYGLLADQACAGMALVRAYEHTADQAYLDAARSAADCILAEFADPRGGFYDVTEEHRKAEPLPYREKLLDENSWTARLLIRLLNHTQNASYRAAAEAALRALAGAYRDYGILAAPYALAIDELVEGSTAGNQSQ